MTGTVNLRPKVAQRGPGMEDGSDGGTARRMRTAKRSAPRAHPSIRKEDGRESDDTCTRKTSHHGRPGGNGIQDMRKGEDVRVLLLALGHIRHHIVNAQNHHGIGTGRAPHIVLESQSGVKMTESEQRRAEIRNMPLLALVLIRIRSRQSSDHSRLPRLPLFVLVVAAPTN
jgi:hypothetical protein